ncbi:hypothetical protein AB6A40_008124 [Gnathostoma spinigerum]|uniref:Tetraspanin n=1 Tax=Gnathostoma spinigerum TaxID=75299 RepID=A0ABD6EPE9_9BILA
MRKPDEDVRPYRALPSEPPRTHFRAMRPLEDISSWPRYVLIACNITFMLTGVGILSLGIWLRADSRFRNFLSQRYRNVVEEAFWQAPTLFLFSYILIVIGSFLVILGSMGCCGAAARSKFVLIVFTVLLSVLMVAAVCSLVFAFYARDGIDVEVSDALIYMVQHYYQGPGIIQESLDQLQQSFRCCGNEGCSDFRAFRQDPPRTCDIRCDGCHYRIMLALRIGFSVLAVVFAVIILAQLVAIFLAIYYVLKKPKQGSALKDRQKDYMHHSCNYGGSINVEHDISGPEELYTEYTGRPASDYRYSQIHGDFSRHSRDYRRR